MIDDQCHSPLHRDDRADPQVNGHSILVSDSVGSAEVKITHHMQNYTFNNYVYYAFKKLRFRAFLESYHFPQ